MIRLAPSPAVCSMSPPYNPRNATSEELLEAAALAECYSDHPIARSLREALPRGSWTATGWRRWRKLSGRGIRAVIDGKTVCVGNQKLMAEEGSECHKCHRVGTLVHVSINGQYAGHIVISDEVKDDAAQTISRLKELE